MRLRVRHVLWAGLVLAQALLSEGKGKDYYGMLGLKKNASEAAIKKAYRCVCFRKYTQRCRAKVDSKAEN